MPDHMDVENAAVTQRFIDRQREYADQQKRPRRPIAAPAVIEKPVIYGDEAAHLLAESAHTEQRMIALVQARSRERQAAEAEAQANAVQVPAFDPSNTEPQLRAMLAEAIAASDRCLIAVGIAEGNVNRSQARMDEADSQLRDFAQLDSEIASHRVIQIKQDRHDPLPAALAEAQVKRGALIDDIDAAHKAHQRLKAELEDVRRDLSEATAVRVHLAAFVVSKHAEVLAHHLSMAMDRVELVKRQLLSASAMWITSTNGAVSLPLGPFARQTIHREVLPVMSNPAYTSAFHDWHQRLLNDPQAQLYPGDAP